MGFYRQPIRVECVGDSFERGYALGRFSDRTSTLDPLWNMSSPSHVANLVLRENNAPVRFRGGLGGLAIGGLADAGLPAAVSVYAAVNGLTSRDWMLFEDAGLHNQNPETYQAALEAVLTAALAAGVRCAVVTAFDFPTVHGLGIAYEWDTVIPGFGRSMNAAKIAAANAKSVPIIDENAAIDAYRAASMAADGVDPIRFSSGGIDGIHAGPWATVKQAGLRLAVLGFAPFVRTYASLAAIASANSAALASGSSSWSSQKAVDYCAAIRG